MRGRFELWLNAGAERQRNVRYTQSYVDASISSPMEVKLSKGKEVYWTDHENICKTLIVHMKPAQYQDTSKDKYQERA